MKSRGQSSKALRLTFASTPLAVRDALRRAISFLSQDGLSDTDCGTAELVLAEVMNNIVEHAYTDNSDGKLDLRITLGDRAIYCVMLDSGLPMPDNTMPSAQHHTLTVNRAGLPEGGFGWMLIRELVRDLRYRRTDGANRLSFWLPVER